MVRRSSQYQKVGGSTLGSEESRSQGLIAWRVRSRNMYSNVFPRVSSCGEAGCVVNHLPSLFPVSPPRPGDNGSSRRLSARGDRGVVSGVLASEERGVVAALLPAVPTG